MPNKSHMDSPKYKKLINTSGTTNKPAVVYPVSFVDSRVFRADMESALFFRHSLRAAGLKLPDVIGVQRSGWLALHIDG